MANFAKLELIAFARRRHRADTTGRLVGDMRLVASADRYYVQKLLEAAPRMSSLLTWGVVQKMKRTRRQRIDQEFDCAMAMFHRRIRDEWDHTDGLLWISRDGRRTRLHNMGTQHLKNARAMLLRRSTRWLAPENMRFVPTIEAELKKRGEAP